MVRAYVVVVALALMGCKDGAGIEETDTDVVDDTDGGDTDPGPDTDDEDTDVATEDCEAEIDLVVPLDGSLGVATDAAVVITLDDVVTASDVEIVVEDSGGAAIAGEFTVSGDGHTVTWTADADLEVDETYTADVTVCEDTESVTFRTMAGPLDESIELAGRVYALDFEEVTWQQPSWGSTVSGQLGIDWILMKILDHDEIAETLDAAGAVGFTDDVSGDPYQAACYDVLQYPDVDFVDNPVFRAGPEDLTVPTGSSGEVTIEDLLIVASFTTTADALEGIDITGRLDTRGVDAAMGIDVCGLAATFGDECVECRDGQVECLDIWLTADRAEYRDDVTLDETYDPDLDSQCTTQ